MIGELIESGRIVDIILALMVIEADILLIYRRRTGYGPVATDVVGMLLAGAALMLALRGALTGAGWNVIALWLTLALAAHLFDLKRRWRV